MTPLVQGRRVVDLALLRLEDPPADNPAATSGLADIVEDVEGATGKRYSTGDDAGAAMDALKIVADPRGGYLGVHHTTGSSGVLVTRVATSTDLMLWRRRALIDEHASQATIAVLVDRSVLIAEEADTNGSPQGSRTWFAAAALQRRRRPPGRSAGPLRRPPAHPGSGAGRRSSPTSGAGARHRPATSTPPSKTWMSAAPSATATPSC